MREKKNKKYQSEKKLVFKRKRKELTVVIFDGLMTSRVRKRKKAKTKESPKQVLKVGKMRRIIEVGTMILLLRQQSRYGIIIMGRHLGLLVGSPKLKMLLGVTIF